MIYFVYKTLRKDEAVDFQVPTIIEFFWGVAYYVALIWVYIYILKRTFLF